MKSAVDQEKYQQEQCHVKIPLMRFMRRQTDRRSLHPADGPADSPDDFQSIPECVSHSARHLYHVAPNSATRPSDDPHPKRHAMLRGLTSVDSSIHYRRKRNGNIEKEIRYEKNNGLYCGASVGHDLPDSGGR